MAHTDTAMITLFISLSMKLFFLLTPFFVLTVFLSMTEHMTKAEQRLVAIRTTMAVMVISLILYFAGNPIFSTLGITLDGFRIGAGSLLFLSAVSLVSGKRTSQEAAPDVDFAVVPLAIPITVGPATIGTLLILGAVATALVLLFLEPFARLLGADEITLDYVKHYLLGLAPFSVCYLVSYNLEVLVKTDGYPRYALFTVIGGCLTNCVLDYIAIFHLDMGVFGAAVATGISQLVTCISYFVHFFSKKCTFRLCKFRFDPHLYARILPIGLADGVTELCTGLMIFLFNRTVLKYIGTDGVVTYTVIAYVTSLIIQLMVGISQGSQPLVSFQYGRGDRAACRKLLRYALTTVCIAAPVLFLGLYVFAPQLVRLYLSHAGEELVAYSVRAFRHYSVSYLFLGFNIVIGGFLTALERPVPAISISVGRGLVLQSAVLLTLAAAFGGEAIWYTPVLSEAMCLVMSLLFLRSYRRQTDMQA